MSVSFPPRQAIAQRRNLTILFSDLCGSTRLAAAMEAETYAELLGALRDAWEQAIPQHGGTIARIHGDGVLAVFGHPQAREDDARRAVEAALELHRLVRDLRPSLGVAGQTPLALHSGVHSGLVLVQGGDDILGRLELLGNAANLAARLSDSAGQDQILVSAETLGPELHFFETGPAQHLSLEGLGAPIAAHAILGRAAVQTRFEAHTRQGLTPFTGREAERAVLERCLAEVIAGEPRRVVVSAPPGVGKTRLAEEFLQAAAARGCRVLRGYCDQIPSAEPLQPFLQMTRKLFALSHGMSATEAEEAVRRKLAELAPHLQVHAPDILRTLSFSRDKQKDGADRAAAKQRSGDATHALLAALIDKTPTVLFIDDWQWADDASRKVLRLICKLHRGTLMVMLTTRDPAGGPAPIDGAEVIELTPLGSDDSARTIAALLPRMDPFLVAEIHRYSGGNPLFIEELCHSAAHEDMDRRLVRMHGGGAWLNVLIESRLARLAVAQAELVRAAAVVGTVVPVWLLERITGAALDEALVRQLSAQDFIFPGESAGTLRFKHGITRDVIYDSVGLHQRRAIHLRIAEALKEQTIGNVGEDAFEGLAYHYGAANRPADAAHYAELAGDRAVAASALDRAKTQYHAALSALDALDPSTDTARRWSAISQRLGLVCVFDAARADLPVFHRAVALASQADDPAALARARYWLGYIHYSLGELRAAIGYCEAALESADAARDERLAANIRATLGETLTAACDYPKAIGLLDGAITHRRPHAASARTAAVGLAFSLVCKGWILGDRGEFGAGLACIEDAHRTMQGATHEIGATISGWQGAILLWQGRWAEAGEAAAESERIAAQTHSLYQYSISRAIGAYARWMLEQRTDALDTLQDATAWIESRESGLYRSLNHGWLAEGLAASGRTAEARHHAALALMRSRQRDWLGVPMALRALARSAAAVDDMPRSEHYLARALRAAATRQSAHEHAVTRLCEAQIRAARGERAPARGLVDQAMTAFEAMNMRWHLAQAQQLSRLL